MVVLAVLFTAAPLLGMIFYKPINDILTLMMARYVAKTGYKYGKPFGLAELGEIYLYGRSVIPKDEVKALDLSTRAAQGGDPTGMVLLGDIYNAGLAEQPKDKAQALMWYRRAAGARGSGASVGMYIIGDSYQYGLFGLPHDDVQAVYWYRRAIATGGAANAMAMSKLARMYESGRGGLPRDAIQAAAWYRLAAALGNSEAYDRLKGLGVSRFELLKLRAPSTYGAIGIGSVVFLIGIGLFFWRKALA